MMLSQPGITGVFVLAAAVAFAGGWMQRDLFNGLTFAPVVENAEAARPGVPGVPDAERDAASVSAPGVDATETASTGPIVTVNGRPLNGDTQTQPEPASTAEAETKPEPPAEPEPEAVAAAEPPKPMPRPEGLSVPQSAATDYEAITASAYENGVRVPSGGEFMTQQERTALAAPAQSRPAPRGPGGDELVAVVGPDGEMLWVYEEQAGGMTAQRRGPSTPARNPYGFVYDDQDFRW